MFLILLGPPGAGKGTITRYIIEESGVTRISTGDLLRREIREGTELGRKAAHYMDKGELVPDPLILDMVETKLSPSIIELGVIFDGFPRTLNQAKSLDILMDKLGITLDIVVLVEVEREELIRRMLDRRTCSNPKCQTIYSVSYDPPQEDGVCDNCGSELISRTDQQEDVISHRLDVYQKKTAPLISYYEKEGLIKRYTHKDSIEIAKLIIQDVN